MSPDEQSGFEQRVTDALDAFASRVEPADDAWERVRGAGRGSARRALVAAVAAAVVVVAGVAGGVALTRDGDTGIVVGTDPTTSSIDDVTTSTASTTVPAPTTTVVTSPTIFDESARATVFVPLDDEAWAEVLSRTAFLGTSSPAGKARAIADEVISNIHGDVPVEVEVNVATRTADAAVVEITFRRLPDDAVEGFDYRLGMADGTEGWTVVSAEYRSICSRGLDTAQDLCV
jgi:hypothetical protein